jgi:hypothetical protein
MAQEHGDNITLAGAKLQHNRHVCAFFNSQHEEYDVMLPFIKEGIERGEKAFHIVDPSRQADHRQCLEAAGMNTAELESTNQLEIRLWEQAYLRSDNTFKQYDMIALLEETLLKSQRDEFPLIRCMAHMGWAAENHAGVEDLIEYESRLNYILPRYHDPVICIYDLAKFSAATVIGVLRTHPMVIIGGMLQENPFYVQPNEFLSELHSRRA